MSDQARSNESDRTIDRSYAGVRAAVLGASGFIGRWVARRLCACGAEVVLMVRDAPAAEAVLAAWQVHGRIIQSDLRDEAELRGLIEAVRPVITFNLAGYGVDPAERDAAAAYQLNARLPAGLAATIGRVRDPGWPGQHLVHAGTALEYGAIGGDLPETVRPRPTTLYGRSKLAGTLCLARRSMELGLKSLTARLFTVYGPGEHPGRLLPSLAEAALSANPIPLTGGLHRRDFTYVEDVAEGLLRLGLAQAAPGEVVNLATGRLTPVRSFVETAARLLQIPPEQLEFGRLPTRAWEMQHVPVTLQRLQQIAGWSPPTRIEDGLRKTMEFIPGGAALPRTVSIT